MTKTTIVRMTRKTTAKSDNEWNLSHDAAFPNVAKTVDIAYNCTLGPQENVSIRCGSVEASICMSTNKTYSFISREKRLCDMTVNTPLGGQSCGRPVEAHDVVDAAAADTLEES